MSDFLLRMSEQPAARNLIKSIGLPTPQVLTRASGGYQAKPLSGKTALFGAAAGGFAGKELEKLLGACGATVRKEAGEEERFDVLAFDATGVRNAQDLRALYDFFHPVMRSIKSCGRILILTGMPEAQDTAAASAAMRGVEGFTRSIAKEVGKKGTTANLLYVGSAAAERIAGPARFFLSPHSAFVDGQPMRVTTAVTAPDRLDLTNTLKGKVALVTGAARGIGAATARRMAAEGAHVVCLDIPADEETLNATAAAVGGSALPMDVTDANAPGAIAKHLQQNHGGVDIVVHNAGVTRDKTLANMKEQFWDMVLSINLGAILAIDEELLGKKVINDHGRVVCLSSIGGIAGNMGQTNYGATKAALIGYVAAQSGDLAERGICINAVAPGFIETRMTAEMPFMIREGGRRMCSLSQGGQPEDVAELITFLGTPGACGVTGQTIRVCGQSLIGA